MRRLQLSTFVLALLGTVAVLGSPPRSAEALALAPQCPRCYKKCGWTGTGCKAVEYGLCESTKSCGIIVAF